MLHSRNVAPTRISLFNNIYYLSISMADRSIDIVLRARAKNLLYVQHINLAITLIRQLQLVQKVHTRRPVHTSTQAIKFPFRSSGINQSMKRNQLYYPPYPRIWHRYLSRFRLTSQCEESISSTMPRINYLLSFDECILKKFDTIVAIIMRRFKGNDP